MKRFCAVFWLVLIVLLPVWGQDRAPLSSVLPVLEDYIEKEMKAEGIPGAAVVVVKDGQVAYIKGFGVRVLGQNDPVNEHTPFALASVTKTFTNTLVARLVDQGKINWKDKVSKYFPEFSLSDPKVAQEMTIEDMLSHRSGLHGYAGDTLLELGWSASEILPKLKDFAVDGKFRESYAYQNVMVGIVGNILEKITGKPIAQLFQEELFDVIDMKDTELGKGSPPTFWQKILALFRGKDSQPTYHDRYKDNTRYLPNGNPALYAFPASSGLISSAHDIGKWMIFQLSKAVVNGKTIVSEANLNEMRTPHVNADKALGYAQFPKNRITHIHYGMGWFIHDYAGISVLSHMGGMAGTRSIILIVPEENLGIAILTNLGGMRVSLFPEAIRNKFLDLYLKVKDEQDWAKGLREEILNARARIENQLRAEMLQNLAPSRKLDDYVGVYENSLYGRIEVSKLDNSLMLSYRNLPKLKLTHWNANTFRFDGSDLSYGFVGTDLGEVIFTNEPKKPERMLITLLYEGGDSVFRRVS